MSIVSNLVAMKSTVGIFHLIQKIMEKNRNCIFAHFVSVIWNRKRFIRSIEENVHKDSHLVMKFIVTGLVYKYLFTIFLPISTLIQISSSITYCKPIGKEDCRFTKLMERGIRFIANVCVFLQNCFWITKHCISMLNHSFFMFWPNKLPM